jgi:hypothetical protein
MLIEHRPNHLN